MTEQTSAPQSGPQINIGLSESLQTEVALLVRDRRRFLKRENDMRAIRLSGWIVFGLLIIAYMVFVVMTLQGKSMMPSQNHAAVIDVAGVIGPGGASTKEQGPLLRRAFKSSNTRAVVLHVNSGGGSASEAERLGVVARRLADQYKKPLITHIDGAGASAAYLLALYSDRVYASQYSLTGSVGAVIRSINWGELASTLGVEEVSYASSKFKSMLSPWQEPDLAHESQLQALAVDMANRFADQVFEMRGDRLKVSREEVLEARVYSAEDALKLGLIDEIATLEQAIERDLGLGMHRMVPKRNWYETISEAMIRPVMDLASRNGGVQ